MERDLKIMAKKELTIAQKKNRYRSLQYLTVAGEYVSIATPFAIMAVVNKDEWFFNNNGWRTGIGFSLACLLLAIIVTSITFESEKLNNRKGKYIKLLIGFVVSAFIFMLLRDILDEIAHILWFASLGIAGALGLDISSANFKAKAEMYKGSIQRAQDKALEEQAMEEIKRKAVE